MDSTLTPQNMLENIKTFLVPHEEVVQNDEIIDFIINASVSHVI